MTELPFSVLDQKRIYFLFEVWMFELTIVVLKN